MKKLFKLIFCRKMVNFCIFEFFCAKYDDFLFGLIFGTKIVTFRIFEFLAPKGFYVYFRLSFGMKIVTLTFKIVPNMVKITFAILGAKIEIFGRIA